MHHSSNVEGRRFDRVGVKGRVDLSRVFCGDPLQREILQDPARCCTPTRRPDPGKGITLTSSAGSTGARVTDASQGFSPLECNILKAFSDAGFVHAGGGGPTDWPGTAYPRPPPNYTPEYLFAQTKEDPRRLTEKGPISERSRSASRLRWILLRRLSGNVRKHSLECFAPGRIGVLRLSFLVVSRRFGVGRSYFLRIHRNDIRIYERSKV